MVSFSMTLSDPNPVFKVTVYLQVESQKQCVLGTLKNTNRKPYTVYRMVPLSMTLTSDPDFMVTFFDIEYLRNDTK